MFSCFCFFLRKKQVKLYQTSESSAPMSVKHEESQVTDPVQQTSNSDLCKTGKTSQLQTGLNKEKPIPQISSNDNSRTENSKREKPKILVTKANKKSILTFSKQTLSTNAKLYTNSMNNSIQIQPPPHIQSTIQSSEGQSVKLSQSNLTPVCSVVPSLKVHETASDGTTKNLHCNVNPLFTARQHLGEWIPIAPENLTMLNAGQNLVSAHQNIEDVPNRFLTSYVNSPSNIIDMVSKSRLVHPSGDCLDALHDVSFQVSRQPEPLLPSIRFPMHSTPKSEVSVSVARKPIGQDLSFENLQNNEHINNYQPSSALINTNSSNVNHFANSRNLSIFPYTQEFIFENGKTQNLHVNRSGQRELINQPKTIHTNILVPSYNQHQIQTHRQQNPIIHIPMKSVPTHNIVGSQISTQATFIPTKNLTSQNIPIPFNFHGHVTTHTITQSQMSTTTLHTRHAAGTFQQVLPQHGLYQTPTQNLLRPNSANSRAEISDFMTPEQYNQESVVGNQALSETSQRNTGTKPKKLTMTANSAVRKKLKLTPNNHNLQM